MLTLNVDYYQWDQVKNEQLKAERGINFEQVVMHLERGDILDIYEHPNKVRYPNQQIFVVCIQEYVYLIPFVETKESRFLKTIIPSRKATRQYLEEKSEKD